MSIWSRATDLTSLRRLVRFAIVGAVATMLTAQVVGVQLVAPAAGQNLCPQACNVSFQACANFCAAATRVALVRCQLAEATCELVCVLNGFSFGPALQNCQSQCVRDEQGCLAGAVSDGAFCNRVCNFQFQICNLVCSFGPI
jgi:hypothetical protein